MNVESGLLYLKDFRMSRLREKKIGEINQLSHDLKMKEFQLEKLHVEISEMKYKLEYEKSYFDKSFHVNDDKNYPLNTFTNNMKKRKKIDEQQQQQKLQESKERGYIPFHDKFAGQKDTFDF